jgi:hypothetical protein
LTVGSLLEEVIEAHGGSERWQASAELSVDVSAGGLAVASKFQRSGLRDLVAQVSTDRQRVLFMPYPGPGKRGIFEGGAVRIESDDGRLVRQRLDPRPSLGDARHLLWWDHLDLLYFGASAVWTYLATPLIFATSGFQIEVLEPWTERGEVWRRLAVTFPAELHTHSRQQIFYFGDDGLIHSGRVRQLGQVRQLLLRPPKLRRPHRADTPPRLPTARQQPDPSSPGADLDRHTERIRLLLRALTLPVRPLTPEGRVVGCRAPSHKTSC